MMMSRISIVMKTVCIGATMHLSVLDAALAQTSQAMQDAASRANTDTFKLDPRDLYASEGQNITIRDGSPDGDVTFNSRDMIYGVAGQSATAGTLPSITTYEDLYSYRDTELGRLEAGSGKYGSTGEVNAEANAMSVLRSSEGLPSVSGQDFLFRSREVLGEGSTETAEFGECIIRQETGQVDYSYDNSVINTCDSFALSVAPMTAERTYNGPRPLFNYLTIGGQGYCGFSGVRVRTDAPETCAKLSVLREIPTADRGELSVRACASLARCLELVLDQAGEQTGAIMRFRARPGIVLSNARLTATGLNTNGYVTHDGTRIMTGNGMMNLPAITASPSNAHEIGVSGGSARQQVREPSSGYIYRYRQGIGGVSGDKIVETGFRGGRSKAVYWDGHFLGRTETSEFVQAGCTYRLWEYVDTIFYTESGSEQNTTWTERAYSAYRLCDRVVQTDGRAVVRLNFDSTALFTPWGYNATRYREMLALTGDAACTLQYTVEETVRDANGCVNAWTGSGGQPGKLCGADIPVSPFGMLSDRAATKITITPSCFNDRAGESFVSTNSCAPLQGDSACTFIGRSCSVTLAGGQCAVYENRYQCGEVEHYSSPVVEELNICESNVSCLGDDCILNTGTSGAVDLADTAAKLAAADMLMSDMQCAEDLGTAVDRDAAMLSCQLFTGEPETCSRRTLGLSNCCTTPSGVSVADYLQLAFSVSRLSRALEGTSMANPVTSSWVSMEDMTRNSFSQLTRPLTETWESIIGNSEAAKSVGNALSMEAVKQEMMKKAASWTAEVFGEQAANSIFQAGGSPAFVGRQLQPGSIGLTQAAATVMSAVMTAYTIYTLINVLSAVLFACSEGEQELMVKRALKSTHEIGEYCSRSIFGHCVSRRTAFCTFNSPLSRIMNEQAREQLGISWGSPRTPNCQGITVAQFQSLDMDQVDLSEWTGMMMSSGMIDFDAVTDIERLTGTESTYGKALEDLYTRQDAITRNTNRYETINSDQLREDAVADFGRGAVQ